METPGSMVNNNAETSIIFHIIDNTITVMKQWNNYAMSTNKIHFLN